MKNFSIIKYVFLIVGLALLTGAFFLYQNKKAFLAKADTAQGTVIELLESRSDNSITYKPLVSFKTKEGAQIEFTSSVSSNPPSYSEGETVEVLYDPSNPRDANINGFSSLWLGPLILGILGAVFSLIGFSIIFFKRLKQRKSQYLLDNGKRISTKFDSIQLNSSYKVNGRSPFQIYSQWQDATTNKLYVFKSDDIWFDPTDFIGAEPIKVMIDPQNPKKYYMDISFLPKMGN